VEFISTGWKLIKYQSLKENVYYLSDMEGSMRKTGIVILFIFIISELFCCTIGVINGSATADGRPIIWKSREAGSNVQVFYEDGYTYEYIGSGNSGSDYAWMGMNEAGLVIANAMVSDLDRLPGNGDCMLEALRNYSTVAEFLTFLDSTNVSGRETHTNYVMMDATGAAVLLEVGFTEYWVYDTADTANGFLVRDNFSMAGSGTTSARYLLMNHVLSDLAQAGPFEWEDIFPLIIKGFYDEDENLLDLPYDNRWDLDHSFGYLSTSYSNNPNSVSSVTLMHGVTADEPAWLSTMWTSLGVPTCSIALPFWAVCPAVPQPAAGNPSVPLTVRAAQIRQLVFNSLPANWADSWMLRNTEGTGYWDIIDIFEEEHFAEINELRDQWINNPPTINELQQLENQICNDGYQTVMEWEPVYNYQPQYECDPEVGAVPLTVHFTDCTQHAPDSLAWDFDGDGIIDSILTDSLGYGVEYTYTVPGTYSPVFYAWHDAALDSVQAEGYITVEYPDVPYLTASKDSLVCDLDEEFDEEVTIYNTGDYPVLLRDIYFTTLEGYPHPEPALFNWSFIDELELPLIMAAGDSCEILVSPELIFREYWGETMIFEADLDTLNIPCLYDEDLWNIGDEEEDSIALGQCTLRNYPNPFNPTTKIDFSIPQAGLVDLAVYNLKGQKVKTLYHEQMTAGKGSLAWSGMNELGEYCGSGIYFLQLTLDGKLQTLKRCLLLK
jgi:hypothetical protein